MLDVTLPSIEDHARRAMAHFKVPDCFLPTAVAPGDVILQAKERDAGEGGQDGGRLVQFFCHAG